METNRCIYLTEDEQISDFYERSFNTEGHTQLPLHPNEYVFIGDEVYCYQNDFFRRVDYKTIDSEYFGTIKPRNIEQIAAVDMLQNSDNTVKLITGTWGTGKTFLLAAQAIADLEDGKFDKIVWVRNNVQLKDVDPMGALPGDEMEKLMPFVGPLCDHIGEEGVKRLIEQGKLEVKHLGFLRGRSIKNSIIFCTEAENLTKEQIQLLIARVAEGTNIWLDADCRQRDRVVFERSQGVEKMIDRLNDSNLFGYVHLIKSERSETAALADLLN